MYDILFVSDSNVHSFDQISTVLLNRIADPYSVEKIKQKYINNPGMILVVTKHGNNIMSAMIGYRGTTGTDILTSYMECHIKEHYLEYIDKLHLLVSLVESCLILHANRSESKYINNNDINKFIKQVVGILNDINNNNNNNLVKDNIVIDINSNTLN